MEERQGYGIVYFWKSGCCVSGVYSAFSTDRSCGIIFIRVTRSFIRMIYANLIYFLVVIFVFSTATAAQKPLLSPFVGLPLLAGMIYCFYRISGRWFSRAAMRGSRFYFSIEKKLSILAVILFAVCVFVFDLKYYFKPFSLGGKLPVLENVAGLAMFFLLLSLIWIQARPAYQSIFNRQYTVTGFVFSNIKNNVPIVLPWLVLSLVFDLLALLPSPGFQKMLASPWGDVVLFLIFIIFLALFFPPMIRRIWNCRPMEPGPLREQIEAFCQRQNFSSEILYWPLFEGQVLTAGIMGFVPRFRYLLVTPALLSVLDREELESVVAHEIGHVKRLHLLLYVALFLGFSLLTGLLTQPLPYTLLGCEWFYSLLAVVPVSPDGLLAFLSSLFVLVLMILYFRFLFGYFLRNFERQADLYVFTAQGTARPLIRSFEKIAAMSGNIRNQKSWHHFGIGERIDFLELCEQDRRRIKLHDRKVYVSLVAYFFLVSAALLLMHRVDVKALSAGYEARYTGAVLTHKLQQDPQNSLWLQLLGDLMQKEDMEQKAIAAYGKSLALAPMNVELNNNLAWLLLTAKDRSLRDPVRALELARAAVMLKENGAILDTLAVALWANDLVADALETEHRALRIDPDNAAYYQGQMKKFQEKSWDD